MRILTAAALCLVAAACGGSSASATLNGYQPAKLATATDAKTWSTGSAPNVYAVSTIQFSSLLSSDAGCPAATDDGTTAKVTGNNCTDKSGQTWSGSASFVRTAANAQTGTFTYNGLSTNGTITCTDGGTGTGTSTLNGTVKLAGATGDFTFDVDLNNTGTFDKDTCAAGAVSGAFSYSGHTVGGTGAGQTATWNGTGRIGTSKDGVVTLETKDEVIDSSKCASEAASGTTTIKSGADTVVITYDGATKCDTTSTAPWSLNGSAQGELTGVSCSTTPGTLVLAALALIWLLRRAR